MSEFIPGLALSRLFFEESVKPVIDAAFPDLRFDAALIDSGSEVLGFDTEMSRDHHWGPRVSIFVSDLDHLEYAEAVHETMKHRLPYTFRGYSTSFEPIPGEKGALRFVERSEGGITHRVSVVVLRDFVRGYLGLDLNDAITPADWLTFPQQKLRTLTQGPVYHSGLGEVLAMRERLHYYPRDLWLYLLAAQWTRISQEDAFVGRTGDVGDDLGSRVIAARLIRDMMTLCFLMERVYAPYPKWFGTGFAKLACAPKLTATFQQALSAEIWSEREKQLSKAYQLMAEMHNALGITYPLSTEVSPYHGRPYQVIHAEVFAEAIRAGIEDSEIRRIAEQTWIGSIDQFSDSTDLRESASIQDRLKGLFTFQGETRDSPGERVNNGR